MTLINTRDCFAYDLICKEEVLDLGERKGVIKKTYYFYKDNYPKNYK